MDYQRGRHVIVTTGKDATWVRVTTLGPRYIKSIDTTGKDTSNNTTGGTQ